MAIDAFQGHVASFLSITDGARLSRVNRAAYNLSGDAIGRPSLARPSAAPLTSGAQAGKGRKSILFSPQNYSKPSEQKISAILPSLSSSAAPESTQNMIGLVMQLFSTEGPRKPLKEKEIEICVVALEKLAARTEEQEDGALLNQNKAVLEQAVMYLQDFLTYKEFPFKPSSAAPGSTR